MEIELENIPIEPHVVRIRSRPGDQVALAILLSSQYIVDWNHLVSYLSCIRLEKINDLKYK